MSDLTLGQKIRKLRLQTGKSQYDLELEMGASPGTISRIEKDKTNPSKETLLKIIEVLNIGTRDAKQLFGLDDNDIRLMLNVVSDIGSDLEIKKIVQNAADVLVHKWKLLGVAVFLKEGNDTLRGMTYTRSWFSETAMKIIGKSFDQITLDMKESSTNISVRAVREGTCLVSEKAENFICPAISVRAAKMIQRVTGLKSGIAVPIKKREHIYGVMTLGKAEQTDFSYDIEMFEALAEYIAVAIENSLKYAKVIAQAGRIDA